MVCNDGVIVGIIDWDLASPADPISDLAFTAWSFCPIHQPSHAARLGAPTDIVRRLKLLCGSYGLERSEKLLEAIRKRMRASIDGIHAQAATGDAAFQALIAGGHIGRMERDAQWLDLHRQKWEEKLGAP
jgi:aminoglycoside phosphotransferase (APT) family kinase protein